MKPLLLTVSLLSFAIACAPPAAKPVAAVKHYQLEGKIVSVDTKEQTAAIDGKAIAGFMEAMTMDYPVKSKDELNTLHAGDQITATVDVSDDGSYTLTHIKVVPTTAK